VTLLAPGFDRQRLGLDNLAGAGDLARREALVGGVGDAVVAALRRRRLVDDARLGEQEDRAGIDAGSGTVPSGGMLAASRPPTRMLMVGP
jgi:hypothetical protein